MALRLTTVEGSKEQSQEAEEDRILLFCRSSDSRGSLGLESFERHTEAMSGTKFHIVELRCCCSGRVPVLHYVFESLLVAMLGILRIDRLVGVVQCSSRCFDPRSVVEKCIDPFETLGTKNYRWASRSPLLERHKKFVVVGPWCWDTEARIGNDFSSSLLREPVWFFALLPSSRARS